MNKDNNLSDIENLLILKNQLITLPSDGLLEIYRDISDYVLFIDSVIYLLQNESAFLYIDELYVKKIQTVLQLHRFDFTNKEIIESINSVTICLNDVISSNENYKKLLVNNYTSYQEDTRDVKFKTTNDLVYALSCDAIVYLYLKGVIENLPNDDMTLSSINYFLNVYPHIFEQATMYTLAEEKLNEINSRSNIFRLNTRIITSNTKKKLKKINL